MLIILLFILFFYLINYSDEKLSSTDSPVLKPPKLKEFQPGQVISIDKSQVVRVVSGDGKNIENSTKL